jgi:hypothetical protein
MNAYKSKQYLFVLLKVMVVIAAVAFIFYRIKSQDGILWADFKAQLFESPLFNVQNLVLVVGLTLLNWFFEVLKWQLLARKIRTITISESIKQVLVAHTTSIFTPFKIGEYGAKTVFYDKKQAKKVLFLNFLSNMAQMSATVFFGVIGLYFFIAQEFPGWVLSYLFLVLISILVLIFIRKIFSFKTKKIRGFSLDKISNFTRSIPKEDHLKIVGFSMIRYLSFSLQFAFLVSLLAPVSILEALPYVFAMYLLSSLLPVLQLFDFAIKGGVAVLLFTSVAPQVIVAVALLMWLLNAVFPALTGAFFVIGFDSKKQLKHAT